MPAYDEGDAVTAQAVEEHDDPKSPVLRDERFKLRAPLLFKRRGDDVPVWQRYSLVLVLAAIFLVFTFVDSGTFATGENIKSVLLQETVPACVALAVLVPVIVGEFDLSVGYTLGLTAVVVAQSGNKLHLVGSEAIALALAVGLAVGLLNGILVGIFRFGSLIATLGVGLAISGLSVGISGSQTISSGIPSEIVSVTTSLGPFGLAASVWITLGLALALFLLAAHTPFGRRLFATGANEHVARLAGVRTTRLKIIAFCLAGLLAAIAGFFQVGLSGAANPGYGANLLLPAFAAVFLGATSIRPGTFNVWGTVLAILILAAGFSGLNLAGVPFWVEPVFDGCVLIIAVFFSRGRGRQVGAFDG